MDVLGWKGSYERPGDRIGDLENLIERLRQESNQLLRGLGNESRELPQAEVLSISDTIVLMTTHIDEDLADTIIASHGFLAKLALNEGLVKGLPLRGATSLGLARKSQQSLPILIGPAIDEAAAWHEVADWIGVLMTPCAFYAAGEESHKIWTPYTPPLKDARYVFETLCVKWADSADDVVKIQRAFQGMAPIVPSVASKYSNTLRFLNGV